MKILLIGRPGAGKSTLARRLVANTGWPLLALDRLWHADDYSPAAKRRFIAAQAAFMAAHDDWVIDGNYAGTLEARLQQADAVIWVRCTRLTALCRVLRRSLAFASDPRSRPDMAPGFVEHLDRDYLEFLRFVWQFDEQALATRLRQARVYEVRSSKQKRRVLAALQQNKL